MESYNFAPGPAALPQVVKQELINELSDHLDDQLSILEISHRSDSFVSLINKTQDSIRRLFNLDDDFAVIFVSGGTTMQFALTPMNFAIQQKKVAMIDSGQFAKRALTMAQEVPHVQAEFLDSTKDDHYTRLPLIPSNINSDQYDYLHLTINNTVEGTCYHEGMYPDFNLPVVADMTSCLGEENIDLNRFQMVISSTQKNLGIAGLTIVILRKSWVKSANLELPTIMQYQTFIDSNSLVNTPPVFPIFATSKMLDWIENNGGVAEMDHRARERAQLLYDFLDDSKKYSAPVKISDRSIANVVFTTGDDQKDLDLASRAAKAGLYSIKGYRGFGGLRASLYNGMPIEGVQALVKFLGEY
ncbi:3-phosphoserine/phosphohydroxythreonine transaminase [Xylocopilactobacillus apicola]|uniref:Phosphoserine aminotransferase n=1 Tax=Xylocopilactobacillus apicola TaxID=2932184 RepID=A0AAU9DS48_9LACO|nr:3-phosphoserine/phosphohydroxythreonine transaminase [Xylocopilactobacillus apicola]BDR58819.1 phosphoserine aminotransferase [Xylocopilactobacillus apicola]